MKYKISNILPKLFIVVALKSSIPLQKKEFAMETSDLKYNFIDIVRIGKVPDWILGVPLI